MWYIYLTNTNIACYKKQTIFKTWKESVFQKILKFRNKLIQFTEATTLLIIWFTAGVILFIILPKKCSLKASHERFCGGLHPPCYWPRNAVPFNNQTAFKIIKDSGKRIKFLAPIQQIIPPVFNVLNILFSTFYSKRNQTRQLWNHNCKKKI